MITPFFNNINLGITSKCNAHCDFCNRQTFKDFPDMNKDMNINVFSKVLDYTNHIEFCGSFGDFINHKNSLEFASITKEKHVKFNIETNAGIRDKTYWVNLAKICNSKDYHVQFSIDDIENNINPYRKVKTQTVLTNLKTFISAGGYATVKSILFRFNEHQDLKSYFYDLGVKDYLTQFSMIYTNELLSPSSCKYTHGTLPHLYNLAKHIKQRPKECQWNVGKWIYILDNGEVHPCCNFVVFGAELKDTMPYVQEYTDVKEYGDVYELYKKNKELININNVSLEQAWNNEYNVYIRENFKNIPRCYKRCSLNNFVSNPITGLL